jgi:hypothetical protein
MQASSFPRSLRGGAVWLVALAVFACENDPVSLQPLPEAGTITVDASTTYAWLAISGDDLAEVQVAEPASSAAWDVGLFSTTVTTNGGAAGPGGVEVFCVCGNAAASGAAIQAMTPVSELPAFEAVTAASLAGAVFSSDVLVPAINGWYSGSGAAATVTPGRTWIVREGTASVVLAKVRVSGLQNSTPAAMGQITVEYAVQAAPGEAFGPVVSASFTVGAAPVYLDLTSGALTDASNWDLRFEGWTIRLNGGVSGSGSVRAVLDTATPFAGIDAAYAASAPAVAYSADAFGGVFATSRWYRYNITGSDNQIWPTFDVYVLRRGGVMFKLQLISYYGPAGEPRRITVRYQRLAA